MWTLRVLLIVLSSFNVINCDVKLRILRNIDDIYSPVKFGVNEHAGNNLTLSCEILSSTDFDDQLAWGKSTPDFKFQNVTDLENLAKKKSTKLYSLVGRSDINCAQKSFTPLKPEDSGTYFCGSLKYMIFEVVHILVNASKKPSNSEQSFRPFLPDIRTENFYCNEKMFKCKSNGNCIMQHYVCDKKRDCPDGSDENFETCKGDPCKDKLQCDDGRCIPKYWCCDKHHDPECNVTYPPSCCQLMFSERTNYDYSATYEELEYGYVPYNMTQVRNNGTRYIFISLCILATFFSIVLMLLILSKVFFFAKKNNNYRNRDIFHLEERAHDYRSSAPCNYRGRNILTNVRYSSNNCNMLRPEHVLPAEPSNSAVDALLILSDDIIRYGEGSDRPPSYSDVMDGLEPPPPYSSMDCLNASQ